jgi:hypothetical protein
VISLQAPEGECVVLNYRISGDFELPFRVYPYVEEIDDSRTDIILKVRADIPEANAGASVVVTVPVPRATTSCKCTLPDQAKEFDYYYYFIFFSFFFSFFCIGTAGRVRGGREGRSVAN